jgi:hypothetical protein
MPWRDVPEAFRHEVEWLDGWHGRATGLPTLADMPVPGALLSLPFPHPDRPRGATAMLDAAGAKARLRGCRPGAWLISPKTGWHWVVCASGDVHWLPKSTQLPQLLKVQARNDVV